jgi:hypothetical protein
MDGGTLFSLKKGKELCTILCCDLDIVCPPRIYVQDIYSIMWQYERG